MHVQEEILEDHERAVPVRIGRPVPHDRPVDRRAAEPVREGDAGRAHARTNFPCGMTMLVSTTRLPAASAVTSSHGSGRGAGPRTTLPSRSKQLPRPGPTKGLPGAPAVPSSHGSGRGAGPCTTFPSRSKRLPWQGHAMTFSSETYRVMHPRWVQTAERANTPPAAPITYARCSRLKRTVPSG